MIGYNYQINQFVLGLEGDAGGVLGGNHTVATTGVGFATTSSSYFADIRGRVGLAADRALFYVAGGVAFGDEKTVYTAPAMSFTSGRTGWTIGGGVDYAFTNNWIGRIEYRYTDLGTSNYHLTPAIYDRTRVDFERGARWPDVQVRRSRGGRRQVLICSSRKRPGPRGRAQTADKPLAQAGGFRFRSC